MNALRRSPRGRDGFTLIELLVVMALILVVSAVGVGYVVFGQSNQHSVTAANAVTGALLNARQRARHDGVPTGIRILFSTNGTQASQIQLVQQPEDYNAGQCQAAAIGATTLSFTGVDFLGGGAYPGEIDEATVEAGDYFTAPGHNPHLITSVTGNPPNGAIQFLPNSPLANAMIPGMQYAIVRGPRRLPSEDIIQLPPSIVIDDSTVGGNTLCQNLPFRTLSDSQQTQQVAEIVFSPSGALIGQGTQANKVLLWLRDPTQPDPRFGAPVLVSIQVRTGFISVCPVAPWNGGAIGAGNDPYAFAEDGRASGM